MSKVFIFTFLLLVGSSWEASTPDSQSYEAGVVEFGFSERKNSSVTLGEYLKIMNDAPSTLDIIIFPEMTLNSMSEAVETPEPNDKISPCDSNNYPADNLVKQISCSAKNHNRYVVVNIVTKAKCPDQEMIQNEDPRKCSDREDGFSYYNTNVVFDRNGTLISRYRKFNLFGESVDKPYKPALVTFETDFGIKFGHFVCFDLMFRYPALELVRAGGLFKDVTDIIFTTMWFSELPFLTAVQVQQNWAYSNDVNLLASGANNPAIGSSGTGIYAGRYGSIISVMEGSNVTTLYTATVPKKRISNPNQKIEHQAVRYTKDQMAPLKLKRDQLDVYEMTFLSSETGGSRNYSKQHCQKDLCCNFEIIYHIDNPENVPHYEYAIAFYHGKRTFDGFADGGVVSCTILACQTKNVSTCGVRKESLATVHVFDSIKIDGFLPYSDGQFFYLPTSLDTSILPLNPEQFNYVQSTKTSNINGKVTTEASVSMRSEDQIRDILTFGIYGRDFNLDSAAKATQISSFVILFSIALTIFLVFNSY